MGVNSPHYMGSNWPSNEDSYNWDSGLSCSRNADLSLAFSHWDGVGRGSRASHLNTETRTSVSCFSLLIWCWMRTSNPTSGYCKNVEWRALSPTFGYCWDAKTQTLSLRLGYCNDAETRALSPASDHYIKWFWLVMCLKYGPCIWRFDFSDF